MIQPTGYKVECDHRYADGSLCRQRYDAASFYGPNGIYAHMDRNGWQCNVKKNGETARRGGKDYCPTHRRGGTVHRA